MHRRRESALEERLRAALAESPAQRVGRIWTLLRDNHFACTEAEVDEVITSAESSGQRVEYALVDAFPTTDLFRLRAAYDLHRMPEEVTQHERQYAKIAYFSHFFSQPFVRHVVMDAYLDVGVRAVEARYDHPYAAVLYRKDGYEEDLPYQALYHVEQGRFVQVMPFVLTHHAAERLTAAIVLQRQRPSGGPRRTGWEHLRDT